MQGFYTKYVKTLLFLAQKTCILKLIIKVINNTSGSTNVFHIVEKESGVLYFKDLELHTIELKKFNSNPVAELSEIVSKITTSLG
ncbi:hypothetical protein [Cardinium endosymbiont of Tipula unca]|uniref:hypothetical protein n=1 Tax=Cardinium endosymbiont of Tipula unca TaxID=3066216 RepID=UPI0030D1D781